MMTLLNRDLWLVIEGKIVKRIKADLVPSGWDGMMHGGQLYWVKGKTWYKRPLMVWVDTLEEDNVMAVIVEYDRQEDIQQLVVQMYRLGELTLWESDDPERLAMLRRLGPGYVYLHQAWSRRKRLEELDRQQAAVTTPEQQARAPMKWSVCGIPIPLGNGPAVQVTKGADATQVNIGCGAIVMAGMVMGAIAFISLFLKIVF